ncbi:MAG: 2Fe-2S iron-sulfur cluster-binding protein, partial [Thermacetogeniaceae bacterium]
MKRCKVTFQPVNQEIYISPGITVKDAINLAGLELDFPCGGRGKCGKCRLQIPKGAVAPTQAEQELMDDASLGQGFRLACMARITGDTVVELPYVTTPKHQILIAAVEKQIKLEPHLSKTYLEMDPPDLRQQQPDWERLHASTEQAGLAAGDKPALELLRALPQTLRETNWRVTVLTDQENILGMEPLDTTDKLLGIAFDIGTTTVVGYLLDLRTGQELAAVSALNPQTRYGADVITRIALAAREESGLAE